MPSDRKTPRSNPSRPFLAPYAPISGAPIWLRILLPALVAVAAFVAFIPALDAGFVNWDDDKNITNNPAYRGLGGEQLKWMFKTTKMGHWQPLSWITLALDYKLHGEDHPAGYHLTNMLLHAAGALAFYFLALRLLTLASPDGWHGQAKLGRGGTLDHGLAAPDRATLGEQGIRLRVAAAFAALFFAIHPLRVEAVAWVTERRDVLSGLLFIATINAYLISRTAARFRTTWYVASIGLLVLSVLSKAWGMTMPAILLVLDFYPLRRFGAKGSGPLARRSDSDQTARRASQRGAEPDGRGLTPFLILLEKLPFAIIAVAVAIQARDAQAGQLETLKSLAEHGVADRIAQAFYGLAFYVYKTVAPFNLIPIYEIPENMNPLAARFVISAVAVLAAIVLLIRVRRRWPAGIALAICYLAIFSPVSGVAQSGPQLVKDSYTYLCCLSWAMLAGGLLLYVGNRWGEKSFKAAVAAGGVVLVAFGALTWKQTTYWRESKLLWTRTLEVDPNCWNARNNLAILVKGEGDQLKKEGQGEEAAAKYREAAAHYRRSLEIHPRNADALYNLGNCLKAMEDYDAAIASYIEALEVRPELHEARLNLANTYRQLGQLDKSIPQHEHVARRRGDAQLYIVLGDDLQKTGQPEKAEGYYRLALGKRPNSAPAHTGLAQIMLARGDCASALSELHQALAAQPDYPAAKFTLERARAQCP